ncbi:MAG: hypothetical protein BGO78_05135 [Chloroflexi bacterium 44-23]|nr:MAG: hypothetical protein BGO78_05135 [Chloroflexi bacterium 44-23]
MEELTFRAMGCQISIFLDSDSSLAKQTLAQVPIWFEEWEQILSRFRPDSELSLLNHQSGIPTAVSDTLWEVLTLAIQTEMESNGLVTPLVLPALEHAGYDRSFELIKGSDFSSAEYSGYPVGQLDELIFNLDLQMIQLPLGSGLDFGGIAKGWAAHQAAQRLAAFAPALVNAGGDIAVTDSQHDDLLWTVGIINPFQAEQDLALLEVGQCGIATSGVDFRQWHQNGVKRHHIIDPRTGLPAQTDLMSATVIAPDVMQAEMAAKVAMLMGSRAALEWFQDQPWLQSILVLTNGQIAASQPIEPSLWRER